MDHINIPYIMMQMAVLLFSLSLHEFGHAYVADKLGDPTARMLGRLTINPFAHADLLGTIILPIFMMVTGVQLFGWAKPVPVTRENFSHPRRDDILVSIAGPAANMFLFVLSLLALWLARTMDLPLNDGARDTLFRLLQMFFILNFILALFNLMPIAPLDGSWILKALLPPKWSYQVSKLDPYGFFIVLGMLWLGVFNFVFRFALSLLAVILNIFGLGFLLG